MGMGWDLRGKKGESRGHKTFAAIWQKTRGVLEYDECVGSPIDLGDFDGLLCECFLIHERGRWDGGKMVVVVVFLFYIPLLLYDWILGIAIIFFPRTF
jgi:hypothetical protein